jgi:hypothetical protein
MDNIWKTISSTERMGGGGSPLKEYFLVAISDQEKALETLRYKRLDIEQSDLDDPSRLLRLEDEQPVVEANPELTRPVSHQMYLPTPVVFATGVADAGDHYIVANGEADLACRITQIPKALFA